MQELVRDYLTDEIDDESDYELIDGVQYGQIKYEIIGGEKVYMAVAAPNISHGIIVMRLGTIFSNYIDKNNIKAIVLGDNADLYLSDEYHFMPDVSIICDLKIVENGKKIYGAPDLIVEVFSESTMKNDIGRKKDAYEQHGVREYWLVDPDVKSITVYHLVKGKFEFSGEYKLHGDNNEIKVSIFDDLVVDIRNVFKWWLN